ncbi:MAG: type II CRISPR RNA-guided endonuclease Cas9 [Thermoguttaceae bacterium]|nr:type II CRISPR RNA-guided endonuclease Cas9 [Thermoguttaceae bacterium]
MANKPERRNGAKKANIRSVEAQTPYVLGLDLGVTSVGWAIAPLDGDLSDETLRLGVRIFEAGADGVEEGKDESRNAVRRGARQIRRGFWRTRRRIVKLFNVLKDAGLLPEGETSTPELRQDYLNRLDRELFDAYFFGASRVEAQTFLYSLRARALDEKLSLFAVGRALLHLAVRRGFLSNKKVSGAKKQDASKKGGDEDDEGVVKGAIAELAAEMQATGARTVGEFFANLDPMKEGERIRRRYLGRKAIQAEFDAIWASQARFYPEIFSDVLRRKVRNAIFFQRPLKSQKGLIGRCELEPGLRRVVKGDPAFQAFRIWQRVLDLELCDADGDWRPLTPDEQDKVAAFLNGVDGATFNELRKLIGVKKSRDKASDVGKFNFEVGDDAESKLLGNRTRTKIAKILNAFDFSKTDAEIDAIAREILVFENEEALARRLGKMFPEFGEELAAALAQTTLETARANLSRRAAEKLTAAMIEKRERLQTVRKALYGDELQSRGGEAKASLPPVLEALGDVRNPTVLRALTEMRKVVNAIIRTWGKPTLIRVELARDLKRGRKEREELFRKNKKREKERDRIRKLIKDMFGYEPRPFEILKWRLWEECNGDCPYTGIKISERQLLGDESPVDVEHIVPFSRSLDDSFTNKTLCMAEENRNVKRNKTPFEAYGGDEKKWNEMLERVRRFRGDTAYRKYQLFAKREVETDGFVSRMLNDTRYISRLATKYLGVLYGAVDGCEPSTEADKPGTRRVQISTGNATAWLRDAWDLDRILAKDGKPKKNRDDLRHHAVDALTVALIEQGTVKKLADSAEKAEDMKLRRLFAKTHIPAPSTATGERFADVVARAVDRIVVSHRVDRKVSGALHEETNYGAKESDGCRAVRKPLTSFSAKDVDAIVDPAIRAIVQAKWKEIGADVKKENAKKFESNPPYLTTRDGRRVPIRKARYWKAVKTIGVGGAQRTRRYVAPGSNSHMEVYAVLDKNNVEKEWRAEVVSTFEARRRKRDGEPVVRRDFGPNTRFLFSLALREALTKCDDDRLLIVSAISQYSNGTIEVECKAHNDGRASAQMKKEGGRVRLVSKGGNFISQALEKYRVDALGNVRRANE